MLMDDQRHALEEDGYLALGPLFTSDEVRGFREMVDEVFAATCGGVPPAADTLYLDNLLLRPPDFARFWCHPSVLAAAAGIIGPDIQAMAVSYRGPRPGHCRLVDSSPLGGRESPGDSGPMVACHHVSPPTLAADLRAL
jgi:hypothetical protein